MVSLPNLISISATFLSCFLLVLAQDDPQAQYTAMERDTLYAFKADFDNSLLNNNWTVLQCCINNSSSWYGIQCLNSRVVGISLEGIGLTGQVHYDAFASLTELSTLSFKNNWISGKLMEFSSNAKLAHVDLSSNMFEGSISSSLLGLQMLESLQLQDNNLMGPIPGFNQQSLREFNVSNNNLSGKIPQTRALQSFNVSSFSGNPGLCGSPTPIACNGYRSESDASEEGKGSLLKGHSTILIIFIVLDVIAVVTLALLFTLCYKKVEKIKERKRDDFEEERKKVLEGEDNRRKLVFMDGGNKFELNDLLKSSAEVLGKGNFGNSYKAVVDDGLEVVVKKLRDLRPLSEEEFVKMIRALANLKHPNLLPPLAYYYSIEEKLLVYKFAMKGNLFDVIHGGRGESRIPFKWSSRLVVAHAVAQAVEFLHANTKSETAIPHGNLKSSNVLIDENQVVLVSDHGLASLIALPLVSQRMAAYKCPEYQHARKISRKADVWSYGSILLELLTGRVSSHSAPRGINGVDLFSWVHRAVREEWTAEIFDSEISQACMRRRAAEGMMKLLQLAMWCCDRSPEKRPDMSQVVRVVEEIKVCDLEDDGDLSSFDRSLTEDSISTSASGVVGEEK